MSTAPRDTPSSPLLLIAESDSKLMEEVEIGLRKLAGNRVRCRSAREFHMTVEMARQLQPDACLLELSDDLSSLRALAAEIRAVAPQSKLVATFRSETFAPEVSESVLMIQAIRAGVQDFLRRPIALQDLSELLEQIGRDRAAAPSRLGSVVTFVSNKGGVGKSTMAVSTASGLAVRHPERVLLIDCSIQMGVCAAMLDLRPATTLYDAFQQRDRLDETLLRQLTVPHSCGLDLLAAPSSASQAAEVDAHFLSQLLTLARRTYDYIVVDTFPLLDGIVMSVLDLSARSYVVLENVVPTLLGGAQYLTLLEQLGFGSNDLRVVVNRYSEAAGNPSLADTEARLRRPVDVVIPFSKRVQAAANLGRPLVLSASRWFEPARGMMRLVEDAESVAAGRGERAGASPVSRSGETSAPSTVEPREG